MRWRSSRPAAAEQRPRRESRALGPWLIPATVLHAALLSTWLASQSREAEVARVPASTAGDVVGELGWVEVERETPEVVAPAAVPRAPSSVPGSSPESSRSARAEVVTRAPGAAAAVVPP